MKGVYSVVDSIATVTTAQPLIQIKAGALSAVEILRAWITNGSVTTDEAMEVQIARYSAAATVTSLTPILFDASDQAAKAVGGTTATGSDGSGGTPGDILVHEGASILAGWVYLPTPEERIVIPAEGILVVKNITTITTATIVAGVIFREIG